MLTEHVDGSLRIWRVLMSSWMSLRGGVLWLRALLDGWGYVRRVCEAGRSGVLVAIMRRSIGCGRVSRIGKICGDGMSFWWSVTSILATRPSHPWPSSLPSRSGSPPS